MKMAKVLSSKNDVLFAENMLGAEREKAKGNLLMQIPWIVGLIIALPILVFGWVVVAKFIKFMNSPIINGQVPVWAIALVVFLVYFLFFRNKDRR
jgi:hypothetical protein